MDKNIYNLIRGNDTNNTHAVITSWKWKCDLAVSEVIEQTPFQVNTPREAYRLIMDELLIKKDYRD